MDGTNDPEPRTDVRSATPPRVLVVDDESTIRIALRRFFTRMSLIFSDESLAAMCRLREVFDPERRANPGKVVPVHSCREWHGAPRAAWSA